MFEPSTVLASLVVSTKKNFFDLGVGFSLGDFTIRACFETLTGPGRQYNVPFFLVKLVLETRR